MAHQFTSPEQGKDAFNCPYCEAYPQQRWIALSGQTVGSNISVGFIEGALISKCTRCQKAAWWLGDAMIYPSASGTPVPHADMPAEIVEDYNEARTIVAASPRGACALLRLAVQKLCVELGEPGKNLNDDIAALVKKGLLPQIQQSLDLVRVVGNNAVHPGELDLKDDRDTAIALFQAMNLIVEQMIAGPKQTAALYASLPRGALDAIQQRDTTN